MLASTSHSSGSVLERHIFFDMPSKHTFVRKDPALTTAIQPHGMDLYIPLELGIVPAESRGKLVRVDFQFVHRNHLVAIRITSLEKIENGL